ncbi:hypothetical protein Ddye_008814 [Dipteronia dyeriana]|uniref:Uncharacterized protein n=1 Tax=Dipteronia dyeriana TaxID=168575 RepID=A0AAD9XAJ5_9ROSI|nr:hypothetical protein Ddye_008814 [Dipteronia dyeriana]
MTRTSNRLRELLKTPVEEWYEGKVTRHDHFDALGQIDDAINLVHTEWAEEDRRRLRASCFGHLLTMPRPMKFSGGIIHQVLLREVHHNGPSDEMWFMLDSHEVQSSSYVSMDNDLHHRYFGGKDEISSFELRDVLRRGIAEAISDTLGGRQEGILDSVRASPSEHDVITEVEQRCVSEEMHTDTELPRERPRRQRRL